MKRGEIQEIERLRNCIRANDEVARRHPEIKDKLETENLELKKRIEQIRNPSRKQIGSLIDVGDNCLAIKRDGRQCTHKRKHGNFCGQHLIHYIKELEELRNG